MLNDMVNINFKIPAKTHQQIKDLADADDRSMRSMLLRLMTEAAQKRHDALIGRKSGHPNFLAWLKAQSSKDTPIADLANDVERDIKSGAAVPSDPDSFIAYIGSKLSQDALDAAQMALKEYQLSIKALPNPRNAP